MLVCGSSFFFSSSPFDDMYGAISILLNASSISAYVGIVSAKIVSSMEDVLPLSPSNDEDDDDSITSFSSVHASSSF
jgi:hypothetical protein